MSFKLTLCYPFYVDLVLPYLIARAADREGQRRQFAPWSTRASGSSGPHQLISKFVFIASLDAFKEPPIRSSLQDPKSLFRFSDSSDSKSLPRFPCFLHLSDRFDHRHKESHFAVFPLGLKNLSGAPSDRALTVLFKQEIVYKQEVSLKS